MYSGKFFSKSLKIKAIIRDFAFKIYCGGLCASILAMSNTISLASSAPIPEIASQCDFVLSNKELFVDGNFFTTIARGIEDNLRRRFPNKVAIRTVAEQLLSVETLAFAISTELNRRREDPSRSLDNLYTLLADASIQIFAAGMETREDHEFEIELWIETPKTLAGCACFFVVFGGCLMPMPLILVKDHHYVPIIAWLRQINFPIEIAYVPVVAFLLACRFPDRMYSRKVFAVARATHNFISRHLTFFRDYILFKKRERRMWRVYLRFLNALKKEGVEVPSGPTVPFLGFDPRTGWFSVLSDAPDAPALIKQEK